MTQQERDVEQGLRRMVEQQGGLCLKWICPGWSGVPDRIILLPGARILFVETKRPNGGRASKLQRWWADRLHALGFEHYWVHTKDDIHALRKRIEEVMP